MVRTTIKMVYYRHLDPNFDFDVKSSILILRFQNWLIQPCLPLNSTTTQPQQHTNPNTIISNQINLTHIFPSHTPLIVFSILPTLFNPHLLLYPLPLVYSLKSTLSNPSHVNQDESWYLHCLPLFSVIILIPSFVNNHNQHFQTHHKTAFSRKMINITSPFRHLPSPPRSLPSTNPSPISIPRQQPTTNTFEFNLKDIIHKRNDVYWCARPHHQRSFNLIPFPTSSNSKNKPFNSHWHFDLSI